MSLILAGTVRLPAENVEAFRPHMLTMLAATRAEDGCIAYAFAEEVDAPGVIRIFEIWRDQAALDAHAKSAHMVTWRAVGPQFGLGDRNLAIYDVAAERAI